MESLGNRIMKNRKAKGLTQDQLAEQLGVTPQAVSKWENDLSCPDITTLPKLAELFGITTDELLGREVPQREEVLVEEPDEDEPEGIHFQKGGYEFHWDSGKRTTLLGAIFLVGTGLFIAASEIFGLGFLFWDMVLVSFLLVFGVFGLFPKISLIRVGCLLLGIYKLTSMIIYPQVLPCSGVVFLALFMVLVGLSMLKAAIRKKSGPSFQVLRKKGSKKIPAEAFQSSQDSFTYSASFSEGRQLVPVSRLSGGQVDTQFGEYTIDLTQVEEVAENCLIQAKVSFGDLNILVPSCFEIRSNGRTSLGNVQFTGALDSNPRGIIYLQTTVSFGNLSIHYV